METFLYMLPVIIVFVGFYFLVIRPLQRKYGVDKGYEPHPEEESSIATTSTLADAVSSCDFSRVHKDD